MAKSTFSDFFHKFISTKLNKFTDAKKLIKKILRQTLTSLQPMCLEETFFDQSS